MDLPVAREPVRPMRIMVVCDGGGLRRVQCCWVVQQYAPEVGGEKCSQVPRWD